MCKRATPPRLSISPIRTVPRREPPTVVRSRGALEGPVSPKRLPSDPQGGPRADCWMCAVCGWLRFGVCGWLAERAALIVQKRSSNSEELGRRGREGPTSSVEVAGRIGGY
ncbi:hypothetical protein NDU88_005660 [Pleurodeles waltl]|uniref:Uncharacterized protein n=1 Tax=Pleurodeles waltl TaxID=8319 RepID=A0AAV7RJ82_PLEWA|nr:hypothetical protein NDU88_005660 [Pleurodeles waltl]